MPLATSKFTGLQALMSKLDFHTDQALAFGDNWNDVEILSGVGFGVAMTVSSEAETVEAVRKIKAAGLWGVKFYTSMNPAWIKPGATAHITLAAWPERKLEGRLLRFGTAADATGGTLDAIFVLPNPEGLIRPGMRAEFSIVLEKRTDVTSIPRAALQGEPASRFVYVKDFDLPNAFVKTPVVVGQSNDRFVEILRGLLPADEVVTQGAYSLAFAGGGTLSLKAALDAAHGHEHAADGSELKPDQKKKSGTAAAGSDHGHDHGDEHAHPSRFWMIVSGVLFVALLVVGFVKKRPAAPRTES